MLVSVCDLHYDHGRVFRRREGSFSLPLSRASPSSSTGSLSFPLYEAFPHAEGRCLRVRGGISLPFFVGYVFQVFFSFSRGVHQPGRPNVSYRARSTTPLRCLFCSSRSLPGSSGFFYRYRIGRMSFPVVIVNMHEVKMDWAFRIREYKAHALRVWFLVFNKLSEPPRVPLLSCMFYWLIFSLCKGTIGPEDAVESTGPREVHCPSAGGQKPLELPLRLQERWLQGLPSRLDSLSAVDGAGDTRAWIHNPLPSRSRECVRDRTNSPGLFLHGRPGGRSKWLVRRLRGGPPLRVGRLTFHVRHPPQRPIHRTSATGHEKRRLTTRTAPHPLCSVREHSARCNRTM